MCHNYYQQPGGEDESFAQEIALLESRGHTVIRFTKHNDEIRQMSSLQTAARTLWSRETAKELRQLIREEQPEVMHCTNTFPLISPSAYYTARAEGVAVVQSLRNFRLLCPGAYLMRDGAVCEACLGSRFAWRAIKHKCYRDSRSGSAAVALMLGAHRALGTWTKAVDIYFALTKFARAKFIEGGLPAEKIAIKPNFLSPDPGPGMGKGNYCLFVGRLSEEKGIRPLLAAWSQLRSPLPLRIVGDGPLNDLVSEAAGQNENITWEGRCDTKEVEQLVGDAKALIVPSLWYEGFPRTVIEAYSKGTPVIASKLGSLGEVIVDGQTGAHFEAGNAGDLAQTVEKLTATTETLQAMRADCRQEYLQNYTAEQNYDILMSIYERALARHHSPSVTA